ncbi:MAG: 4-hydroxythreonine-4-phosphate dehydrogenase PdxA, partial [Proteobacteria bacterium]|nr:4-hydroxythreonine-4-phosphate dehydrogenase PdxA [Pseudomonadota bacterium]
MSNCPRIALTAGEPAGIGPDLCIQLAQHQQQCDLIVIADPQLLQQRAQLLGLPITLEEANLSLPASIPAKGTLRYKPIELAVSVQAGILNKQNAHYVLQTLQYALDECLADNFDAVVTAPVHKGVFN